MLIHSPLLRYTDNMTLGDKYEFLREYLSQDHFMINCRDFCTTVLPYGTEINKWINWVNSRIVLQLGHADYRTIGVLLRIATGMLNKLDYPNEFKIKVHSEMVARVNSEMYRIALEELPF